MAKPFGKLPKDWLKATETKDYLQALAVRRKILTADLVEVRQGGTPEEQGTWCNFFSVSIIEKGCPVVVDTLGGKAGKNEFPAFFLRKRLAGKKNCCTFANGRKDLATGLSTTLTKGDKLVFVSFWFYLYKI